MTTPCSKKIINIPKSDWIKLILGLSFEVQAFLIVTFIVNLLKLILGSIPNDEKNS